MLECFHKFEERFAIGRKRMSYLTASVFFIQKAGLNQSASVLGNIFKVGAKLLGNFLYRDSIVFLNSKQNGDTPMIGRPLEITF